MKTGAMKRGIPIILLMLSICMPDSLWATRRLPFSHPFNNSYWKNTNIHHRFPKGFNYVEQIGWVFNTAWTNSRSRDGEWSPQPTALFVANVLQSNDKQCELYYPIFPNDVGSYAKDSLSYVQQNPKRFYPQPKLAHRNVILSYLSEFKGRADFRFDDYVTAIGGKIPREYFNADSVFFWDFPIEPTELDGETYTECTFMFIWHKRRWIGLTFAWFFTDEGKERKWDYISKLKKQVWYKETTDQKPTHKHNKP